MNIEHGLLSATVFALLGALTFGVTFWLADRITPFNLWNEIVKEKNMALAVLMGSVAISLGMIVASAIRG